MLPDAWSASSLVALKNRTVRNLAADVMKSSRQPMKPPEPDAAFEISLRPPAFSEFTGQVKVRERLELMVEAAKKRGDVLEHILLSGPSGLGKTTLAYIIANAMSVNIKNTSGPVIEKAGELAGLLTSLEKGDALFIDEIHRLQPAIEEYLYPAMEDYRLDIIIDQGPQARSLRLNLPFWDDRETRLLQRRGNAEDHHPQRAFAWCRN